MTLQEMQQRLAQLAAEMRSLHEGIGEAAWSGEQRSKWDAMRAEHQALSDKIKRETELRALDDNEVEERHRRQPEQRGLILTPDEEQRSRVTDAFLRNGGRTLDQDGRRMLEEMRALGTQQGQAGGVTVAPSFQRRIVESLVSYGGIASVAQLLTTDNGAAINWAIADGAEEEGELLGENSEAGEGDPEYRAGTLGSHIISSKVIRISEALLADSGVDLEGHLAGRIASRCGRTRARLIVQGTGTGDPVQPKGLEVSAGIGKATASATKFTWQELNGLKHSVDPAYRTSPKFRFAFNDNTLASIEEMVDGNGRPLWLPGVDASRPSTVLGVQYVVDQAIADIAAGKKFAYCGDFDQLVVRQVRQLAIKRLVERYAEFGQVGFLAFLRFGVVLQDVAAIKALQGKPA